MTDEEEVKQMQLMERHYKRKLIVLKLTELPSNSKLPGPPPTASFKAEIREVGMRSPIEVAFNQDGSWCVLAGIRRIKAARELQWTEIEALSILGLDDPAERRRWQVGSNKYRSDNPMQVAMLIAELAKAGKTETEIAEELRISTSEIKRLGPLTGLPKNIARGLHNGEVALGTALKIVRLPKERQEVLSAKLAENDTLTGADVAEVRQIDVSANVAALNLGPMEYDEPQAFIVLLEGGKIVAGGSVPLSQDDLAKMQARHPQAVAYRLVKL